MIPEMEEAIRMAKWKGGGRGAGSSNELCTTMEQVIRRDSFQEYGRRAR
jgi:hypothetical protein